MANAARETRRERCLDAIRSTWAVVVVIAAIVAGVLIWDFANHLSAGLTDRHGEQLGRDFSIFWSGARLVLDGHADQIYDLSDFFRFERSVFGDNAEFRFYAYPPTFLLLTTPLGRLPYLPAFAIWLVCGTLFCAALLARSVGWRWAVPLSIGAPAAFLNFYAGQNGQFTAVLFAAGLTMLERRPAIAGVAFGLMSFKPHLGILLPFALLAGRHWRALAAAAATTLLLAAASAAWLGVDMWLAFLRGVGHQGLVLQEEPINWPRLPTVFAAARLLGAGILVAYAAQIVSALGAVAAVVTVWRRPVARQIRYAVLIVGMFLATPYAWDYDMVILTFAVAWLAASGGYWVEHGIGRWIVGLVIVSPILEVVTARFAGIPATPVILWLAMAAILRQSRLARPAEHR